MSVDNGVAPCTIRSSSELPFLEDLGRFFKFLGRLKGFNKGLPCLLSFEPWWWLAVQYELRKPESSESVVEEVEAWESGRSLTVGGV